MTDTLSSTARTLRRAVLLVALLNAAYGVVEIVVGLTAGSVSLFADAADFFEDASINALVFLALWLLRDADGHRRGRWGKVMAAIVLVPALAAVVQAVRKVMSPEAPEVGPLLWTALGALVVNAVCAWILAHHRSESGSLARVAWLAARNDVVINAVMLLMGGATWWMLRSHVPMAWLPDLLLGVVIVVLNVGAAKEVWEVAEEEQLAAKALAGEEIGD